MVERSGCDLVGAEAPNEPPPAVVTASQTAVDAGTEGIDAPSSEDPAGNELFLSGSLSTSSGSNAALSDPTAEPSPFTGKANTGLRKPSRMGTGETTLV